MPPKRESGRYKPGERKNRTDQRLPKRKGEELQRNLNESMAANAALRQSLAEAQKALATAKQQTAEAERRLEQSEADNADLRETLTAQLGELPSPSPPWDD